jgi:uncharacterized membrane protein
LRHFLFAYFTTILVMVGLDFAWLNVFARSIYEHGIGHLMAPSPNLLAAAIFYCIYVAGLMWFALIPNSNNLGLKNTVQSAGIFGFFVYAGYEFTNLALLTDWPLKMSIIDIVWGVVLSGLAAGSGKFVLDHSSQR